MDLLSECNSYTEITPPVLSEDNLYGYYIRFQNYDVIYYMKKGGLVFGAVVDHKAKEQLQDTP